MSIDAFIVFVEPANVESIDHVSEEQTHVAAENATYTRDKIASGELLLSARTLEPPYLGLSIVFAEDAETARHFAANAPSIRSGLAKLLRVQRITLSIKSEQPTMPPEVDKDVKTPLPPWAEEPDYVLRGTGFYGDKLVREQLWTKGHGNGTFELRCVPIYLYGMAYGDVVRLGANERLEVVKPSGRATFRAIFSPPPAARDEFEGEVATRGGRVVWFTRDFIAIDAKKGETGALEAWLEDQHLAGIIEWEASNRE